MTEGQTVSVRIPAGNEEALQEFHRALRFLKYGKEAKQKGDCVEFTFFDPEYYKLFVAVLLYELRLYPQVEITNGNGTTFRYEGKKSEEGSRHTSHGPKQSPATK